MQLKRKEDAYKLIVFMEAEMRSIMTVNLES